MADKDVSDLIMKFVLQGGTAVSGETQSEVTLNRGDMTKGFVPGKMFEVDSFKLKTKLDDQDEDSQKDREAQERRAKDIQKQNEMMRKVWQRNKDPKDTTSQPNQIPIPSSSSVGSFGKWRSGQQVKYPADIDRVSFSRALDKASSILLQNCIRRVVYKSASLIKRKAAGGPASGEVFLRFDFDTVLIVRCDWDDDMPVTEKCDFIFRAVTIHYLPQLANGKLGAPIQAFWTMSPGLKPYNLKG